MKYAIAVAVLVATFYLGAHSETPVSGGQACITSIEIGGTEYTGKIKLVTDSNLTAYMQTDKEDGSQYLRIGVMPKH